jgi:hypothetical protein
MIRLLAHAPPFPLSRQQLVSLYLSSCVSPVELTDGRGGRGGTKLYDREKVWPSINNSILSGLLYRSSNVGVSFHWLSLGLTADTISSLTMFIVNISLSI